MAEVKEAIYEPRKFYNESLKDQYHEAAENYFDSLVNKTQTDVEANRRHVQEYKDYLASLEHTKKKAGNLKAWRIFCIVVFFLALLIGVVLFIYGIGKALAWGIIVGVLLVVADGFLFYYIFWPLRKKIQNIDQIIADLEAKAKAKLQECYADLANLNAEYDWNIPGTLIKQVTPILDVDRFFSGQRFAYLIRKFGFPKDLGKNTSVLGVLSGNIQGNPFVLERDLSSEIIDITYTGTLVITWTTTHTDKNGTHTVTHTETLVARSVHPGPHYEVSTRLIYGNEAAPNLNFTRYPSGKCGTDEKDSARFVRRRMKALDKKAQADMMDNDPSTNYTRMANEKFEAYFGADDRDNEVEFRLLYSPLAQKNLLDILTNPEPYGDDFVQVKEGMINSIASRHSQAFDYSGDPAQFRHYDVDEAKKRFVAYCDAYIQGLYFDLAPLISVPLYQTHAPDEYIYGNDLSADNFCTFEQECMANGMEPSYFRPKEADPSLPLILKISRSEKDGANDVLTVHAYSYKTTPQVDLVPVHGGDGHMHNVPVHWTQYDLVQCDQLIAVSDVGGSQRSYASQIDSAIRGLFSKGASHYERGLLAFGLGENVTAESISSRIRSLFSTSGK